MDGAVTGRLHSAGLSGVGWRGVQLLQVLCLLTFVQNAVAQLVDPQTPTNAMPVGVPGNWVLDFSDEFNGASVDTTKWGIDNSTSSRAPRPSQGIDEWYWKPANVSMDGSNLVLSVTKESSNTMHCGSISSDGKYEPTYGYMEARIEIADTTKSTHTAFWLQGENMINGTPADGTAHDGAEVDVFESAWFGDTTKAVVHIDGYGASKQANTKAYSTPGLHNGFHVFGLEWTHDYMKIYYDGVLKVTYTGNWVPRTNEWLWLSDGASFGDVGTFVSETNGWLTAAKFDYVRVWKPVPSTNAPVFDVDPINASAATEDQPYSGSLTNSASDGDNDPLSFSKLSGPAWLSVASDGSLSGTPLEADDGTNSWTVQVADGTNGSDTATLNIVVVTTNDAPLFGSDPIDRPYAVIDVLYTNTVAGEAVDEEGDTLTYTRESGPTWLNVATNGLLSGTPLLSDVGTNTWTLQVSDGNGGLDTATLRIWVKNETNVAPQVDAGLDRIALLSGASDWTPAHTNTAAWYDSADAGTITDSGGAVSQWDDKSGNGHHITQANGANRPIYSTNAWNGVQPAILFDGSDDYLEGATQQTEGTVTLAVVMEQANTSRNSRSFGIRGLASNTKQNFGIANDNSLRYDGDKSDGNMVSPTLGKHIRVATRSTTAQTGFHDGSSNIVSNLSLPDVDGYINVGNVSATFVGAFTSKVAEAIVMYEAISEDTRLKLEGYLAHKWGIEGNLPAGHTYKTVAPSDTSAIVMLNGMASDANDDPLTTSWMMVSGPAPVNFGDAAATNTTAEFAVAGTYVLRLIADDGILQSSNEVTITVGNDSDEDGMEDGWEITNFGDTSSSDGAGDQDSDGFLDLHEFLAGTGPTNSSSLLEIVSGVQSGAANEFVLTWRAVSNKTYMVLSKQDLMSPFWSTNATLIQGVEPLCVHTVNTASAKAYFLIQLQE